jgi:hypothetical protein
MSHSAVDRDRSPLRQTAFCVAGPTAFKCRTLKVKQLQMQSTYWLKKVLKMISLYVNALLCTLQHAMQLSGVNSPN